MDTDALVAGRVNYDHAQLVRELERDEDRRTHLYTDTTGHVSIGVGRNLTTKGLRPDEIDLCLSNDIAEAVADLDRNFPSWRTLDPVRQRVLLNMVFNLGWPKLAGFKRMLAALRARDWKTAADEMMASKWALQVGERAVRLDAVMRTGAEP